MVRFFGLAGGLALCLAAAQTSAEPQAKIDTSDQVKPVAPLSSVDGERPRDANATCMEIRAAARTYQLPHPFLSRLIWQESRFNPKAVSPAGAIGIAQFMPGTAQWRGLSDPFDPRQAIQHSARWLGELRQQFGNLGLAAAAYNAGPTRVQDWLDNRRPLPAETRAYVRSITGRYPEDWLGTANENDEILMASPRDCQPGALQKIATHVEGVSHPSLTKQSSENAASAPPKKPWALQLVGDRSKEGAVQQYTALRSQYRSILGGFAPEVVSRRVAGRKATFWYQIRISAESRERATGLCSKLRSAGGDCLLVKN